jgi:Purple acid Phosphatase, N-terminal domain/Bacterial Ig-like domain
MDANKKAVSFWLILAFLLCSASPVYAGSPSGTNWYQLLASPYTGGDNTGDGGTGAADDLNYYYVGQTWTQSIQILSDNTDASNIWLDHDILYVTSSNLLTGTYFPNWSGQTTKVVAGTTWRIKSTGYRTSGVSSGVGNFGSVQFTALRPAAANYGTSSPTAININIGTVGNTTESNISYLGTDLLDDAEDFDYHVWADTKKPYATNPGPGSGTSGIAVDAPYTFDLRDSKNGEGDNSGVGTGVDTATPPGTITFDDGGGPVSYTSFDSYSCSGVWGTNLCNVSINPTSPSGIPGDTRNWEYNTSYTINIGGFRDFASTNQDQLGDANGPNTADTETWTFTTESDTVAPRVESETPTRGSSGNSISTNISVRVIDKKAYPGTISGSGVISNTCRIRVTSPSFPAVVYQQGSGGVTVTPIDYGYSFDINPAGDFAQNETVSVSVYDCQDQATNTMATDNYTFTTADSGAPYVDTLNPANDTTVAETSNISFHIKDTGTGVDLNNTVIFLNGNYYTNGGGAGQVTVNDTRITFASSLDFNGGNYAGDTTSRTGTSADYTFTLDPQTNFATGEAVPVIIYSRDTTGNLMERYVYAVATTGAGCPAGLTYCGADTSWDAGLLQCIGTGGGGGSCGGTGGGSVALSINPQNVSATQIDEDSVLVVWYTSKPSTGRVVYGLNSPADYGTSPNYSYTYSTAENGEETVYHSMTVNGLTPGHIYYFRPVSRSAGEELRGPEVEMTALFGTQQTVIPCQEKPATCPTCPVCQKCSTPTKCPATTPTTPTTPVNPPTVISPPAVENILESLIDILNIRIVGTGQELDNKILINGTSIPSIKIKMIIY